MHRLVPIGDKTGRYSTDRHQSAHMRRLNEPARAAVEVEAGLPVAVHFRGSRRQVARIEDAWRIDDGWWRPDPVSRTYFRLDLGGGLLLTAYRDDATGTWWTQRY